MMGTTQLLAPLRARDPRIKVCVPARMRLGARWTDAFILNISSRGLLIHSSEPLERGMYVELRRGDQVIVARVVWRSGSRAGLRAQGRVPVEAIVSSLATRSDALPAPCGPERRQRKSDRREYQHERSRLRGRAMEFTSLLVIGATLSVALFSLVSDVLEQPLSKVRAALAGQASLPADSR